MCLGTQARHKKIVMHVALNDVGLCQIVWLSRVVTGELRKLCCIEFCEFVELCELLLVTLKV